MNKKVLIGVVSGVIIIGLAVGGALMFSMKDKPVNNNENEIEKNVSNMEYETPDNEEFVGVPVPNIINRGGTINKVKKYSVIINGPEDKEITIYIDKNTEIFGADGSEKEVDDLNVGMYIDVEIDGDLRNENDPDDEFDAMTIYISGK